mmetsp:Transcript_27118/g.71328  ORF Transcript_27118/g.71328 Transcript_27118/m.71328 type:complete len:241 (+) Transcript_27118:441-1163(+)
MHHAETGEVLMAEFRQDATSDLRGPRREGPSASQDTYGSASSLKGMAWRLVAAAPLHGLDQQVCYLSIVEQLRCNGYWHVRAKPKGLQHALCLCGLAQACHVDHRQVLQRRLHPRVQDLPQRFKPKEAVHAKLDHRLRGKALVNHPAVFGSIWSCVAPDHRSSPTRDKAKAQMWEEGLATSTRHVIQVHEHGAFTKFTVVVFAEMFAWRIPHHIQALEVLQRQTRHQSGSVLDAIDNRAL